jgi:hypothetical protein
LIQITILRKGNLDRISRREPHCRVRSRRIR